MSLPIVSSSRRRYHRRLAGYSRIKGLLIISAIGVANIIVDAFIFIIPHQRPTSVTNAVPVRPTLFDRRITHEQTQLHIHLPRVPSLTAATLWNEPPVITTAIAAGSTCLGLQLGIQTWLRYREKSTSKRTNGDTTNNNAIVLRKAHSKVALLLMLFVSIWGCWGWFGSAAPTTAAARIWGENTAVSKLAAVIAGAMVLWDIPVSLVSLLLTSRSPTSSSPTFLMLGHHLVMAAVAFVGATALPTHYGFFYLGVSELSSIPLVMYDELMERRKSIHIPAKILDGFKMVTAISFTIVRVIYFTKITVFQFCPDVWALLRGGDSSSSTVLWFMLTASLGFTVLQLYWFFANILSEILWKAKPVAAVD